MEIKLSPNHPFYSANDFFRNRLGKKVIKLALDGGFTCPNRDGTLSEKGCIFCSSRGSGDFAASRTLSITEQIEAMKNKMSTKWGTDNIYMAYFQAYTSTYGNIDVLRSRYTEAISCKDVVALSVATRPDCIDRAVCELLAELSQKVYVCVELGLQTSKNESAVLINRCYENRVYKYAVSLLKSYNIDVITHIILGLPYETKEDMLNSVNYAVACGTDGLKLQLLHILKDTRLYKMYREKPFKVLSYDEYINLIADIIEVLPPYISVHRITGDGSKELLAEPWWSLDKRRVLNGISRIFKERQTYQGMKVKIIY